MDPGGDNGQLLLHAVGISADGLVQIAGNLKGIGQLLDPLGTLLGRDAEHITDEVQVLHAGHKLIQIGIIRDVGHLFLAANGVCLDGQAIDQDLAAVELHDACHAFQRGGLACAVVTDEAVNFTGPDVQGQIVHGLFFAIGLGKMVDFQHNFSPHF